MYIKFKFKSDDMMFGWHVFVLRTNALYSLTHFFPGNISRPECKLVPSARNCIINCKDLYVRQKQGQVVDTMSWLDRMRMFALMAPTQKTTRTTTVVIVIFVWFLCCREIHLYFILAVNMIQDRCVMSRQQERYFNHKLAVLKDE